MKRYLSMIITMILVSFLAVTVFTDTYANTGESRLADNASLLTDSEASSLLEKLDAISTRQDFDVVIVTTDTLDGKSPMAYADDYYDEHGYGMGSNNDGVLLLVSMEDRDWWMSTTGFGIDAITDAGVEYISDAFMDDLSDGNYADAFQTYANLCEDFVIQAKTGKPYDVGHMPKGELPLGRNILISLVAGLVIALIVTMTMRGKMKTVRFKAAASDYMKEGSMNLTESRDLFLYTHLERVARPKDEGGSSTHTSSSGTSHGGGGGKF